MSEISVNSHKPPSDAGAIERTIMPAGNSSTSGKSIDAAFDIAMSEAGFKDLLCDKSPAF